MPKDFGRVTVHYRNGYPVEIAIQGVHFAAVSQAGYVDISGAVIPPADVADLADALREIAP